MKLKIKHFGIMVLLATTVVDSDDALTQKTEGILGIVRDARKAPISGAQIVVFGHGYSTLSDAKGSFVIYGLPPGEYQVVATAEGYQKSKQNVRVKRGSYGEIIFRLSEERDPKLSSAPSNDKAMHDGIALAVAREHWQDPEAADAFSKVLGAGKATDPTPEDRIDKWGVKQGTGANPFITSECLDKAVKLNTRKVGKEVAIANVKEWAADVEAGKLSGLAFWEKVYSCEEFCALVMQDLLGCYAKNVASAKKFLVLFDLGKSQFVSSTQGGYWSNYKTYDNNVTYRNAVDYINSYPALNVLVVGRSSRIGWTGSDFKLRNRDLSKNRAAVIYRKIINDGIPGSRVLYRWLGEEPIHLDQEIAYAYRLRNEFDNYGIFGINQSVLILVYDPRIVE